MYNRDGAGPGRIVRLMGQGAMALAGLCYVAMAALILFDIVARRFLGFSTVATTEISGYLLAIGMTLGLGGALSQRAHVRIDVLVQKMPLRVRVGLHLLSLLSLLLVTGFFAYGAIALAWESWEFQATDVSALRVPLVIPQGLWALGFVLLLVVGLALLARCLRWLAAGQLARIDRALLSRSDQEEARETIEASGLDKGHP
ncbi:TRAP transporter small permease [Verticiella sediminum]|uniref:TRAP transporter small permease protein n=1 Tax=Verticiella sediminum TaxID=1247510 RepID=A0A556AL58_9BURK|nr:TRAP transporter small permease [Verticiella sediminum]TSH93628.1 TRAP transporter small permease [Verticiella sediminum]